MGELMAVLLAVLLGCCCARLGTAATCWRLASAGCAAASMPCKPQRCERKHFNQLLSSLNVWLDLDHTNGMANQQPLQHKHYAKDGQPKSL